MRIAERNAAFSAALDECRGDLMALAAMGDSDSDAGEPMISVSAAANVESAPPTENDSLRTSLHIDTASVSWS